MLKKLRKSSGRVTLVLIGIAALGGCSDETEQRDLYASREDCLADWGNSPKDCTSANDPSHRSYFYGPSYYRSSGFGSSWSRSSSSSSHALSSHGVSRGGFGSSSHSSHSSGS